MSPDHAPTRSDAELLGRAAAGDKEAFAELYDRFSGPLFSLALKITGRPGEAEELVQEVFLELWTRAPDFDASRAQPFTWAVSITRHKAIDRVRSRSRRGAILERSAEDIAAGLLVSGAVDARDAAWYKESAGLIRRAFAELPEDQRAAIELAYFEGLSQSQIAERLAQPIGTIKARIRRGLARLRERLTGKL